MIEEIFDHCKICNEIHGGFDSWNCCSKKKLIPKSVHTSQKTLDSALKDICVGVLDAKRFLLQRGSVIDCAQNAKKTQQRR